MNEPRNSPAKRQQFLIICTIMVGMFAYTTIMAGVWSPIRIIDGKFPGGDFVYKSTKRDYSANGALEEIVCIDLGIKEKVKEDRVFTLFLDEPAKIADARNHRFASGFLGNKKGDRGLQDKLLARNESIKPPSKSEMVDISAHALFRRLRYKQHHLPNAKAAVVYHPFTNGFVSSLLLAHRIIPKLRKYATEKQKEAGIKSPTVTVITTCSVKDSMCTHYAPLEKGTQFLLGQPTMESYIATLPPRSYFDFTEFQRWVRRALLKFRTGKSDDEL